MKTLLRVLAGLLILGGLASLGWYFRPASDTGGLTWEPPVVKKSLMTFAYKVYGNPAVQNGRHFLSKIVLTNKGSGPVRDFSISYQIPDYIPWTTPETTGEIQPGQTVVKLFYPQLPSKVTQLTSQTTVTLETKIQWSDKPGSSKEEVLRSNVDLRGVNEMEYTDLPVNEIVTWYDQWILTPFASAMVTPNDPVVAEYVAEVARRTGGTTAGIAGGAQEIARMMKGIYDYMLETGMVYTSDAGVPAKLGDVKTTVQTVRLPRDVITTNQGLCIELALLWASLMEHVGCKATVVFIPGHAFTAIWFGQGANDFIPIECTAINGRAVGAQKALSFEEAVQFASKELQQQQPRILVNIEDYQGQGFHPPELPAVDIEKIKNILAQRGHKGTGAQQKPQPQTTNNTGGGQGPPPVADGFVRYISPGNWVTVDMPAHWTHTENGPIPGMLFSGQDAQNSLGINVFRYTNLRSSDDAVNTVVQGLASSVGIQLKVKTRAGKDENGDVITYTGTATSRAGVHKWAGLFQVTRGGVLGFIIAGESEQFTQNNQLVDYIIKTVYFGR